MREIRALFILSRLEYWDEKLQRNKRRDAENIEKLTKDGWNVIVVWECELKKDVQGERLSLLYQQITDK